MPALTIVAHCVAINNRRVTIDGVPHPIKGVAALLSTELILGAFQPFA